MQIDNNSLKKITNMSDSELRQIISSVASEKGLFLPNISENDLSKIRSALSTMSSADLERIKRSFGDKGGK
jgi:hypothetical protein